jgi:hypothetical protein
LPHHAAESTGAEANMKFERVPRELYLVELLDRVLDKGIVIDAAVRVAAGGIHLVGIESRIVVASFQTYLAHTGWGADRSLRPQLRAVAPAPRAVAGDVLQVREGQSDRADQGDSREPPEPLVDGH